MTTGSAARRLDRLEEWLTGPVRSLVIGISENDAGGKLMAVQVEGNRIVRHDGEDRDSFMARAHACPTDIIVLFGRGDQL